MEELRRQIIDLCNKSELPLEAIYFVVKDVWRDIESTLLTFKQQQAQAAQETSTEEEK